MLRMWSLCRSNNEKAMNWAAVFQLHSLIPFVDFASTWGIPVLFTPLFEEQTQYSWIEKCILGIAFIVRLRRFFSPWGRLKSIFDRLYCSSPTGFLATNNYKLVYYRFMTWTQFYRKKIVCQKFQQWIPHIHHRNCICLPLTLSGAKSITRILHIP